MPQKKKSKVGDDIEMKAIRASKSDSHGKADKKGHDDHENHDDEHADEEDNGHVCGDHLRCSDF